jgi:hypothetical protein
MKELKKAPLRNFPILGVGAWVTSYWAIIKNHLLDCFFEARLAFFDCRRRVSCQIYNLERLTKTRLKKSKIKKMSKLIRCWNEWKIPPVEKLGVAPALRQSSARFVDAEIWINCCEICVRKRLNKRLCEEVWTLKFICRPSRIHIVSLDVVLSHPIYIYLVMECCVLLSGRLTKI